jgi:phage terminase large subunit
MLFYEKKYMDIKIPYTPRKHQAYLHKKISDNRWNVLVCHRRFGKTVCMINHLIRSALLSKNKNPRYAYIAPTFKQAKSIAWDYMKQFTAKIPYTKFNETELRVDLPNGSRITLLGSENSDGLRGIYLDGCVIDEYANVNSKLFPEIIRPALSDRKGYCVFIGTPAGMNNNFYELYQHAQGADDWFNYKAKASETKIVDAEELVKAKEVMGDKKYQQEFECDWIANIEGAVYSDVLTKMEDQKQLTRVPYDPSLPVSTAWDLGVSDHSAIIFYQQLGKSVNIIDYHEERGQGLPYYVQVIKDKDYVYKDHFAPHDIEVTDFGNGKTRREVAYQLGIRFKVVPKIPLEDGIHATTMTLPRCWIDTDHCKKLIDALRHYHRKYIDKNRMFRSKPVHDWSSHACDAMRYLSVGLQEINDRQTAPQSVADNEYRII